MVLDLEQDDRRRDEQRGSQQSPRGSELGHVRNTLGVDGPEDGGTGGLDTLVETGKVGSLTTRVRERTHEPVDASLPCRIVETVEHIQEHGTDVTSVLEVNTDKALDRGNPALGLLGLPSITTTPDDHGDEEKRAQCTLGSRRTAKTSNVKGESKYESTDDLRDPVESVVQRTSTGVEVSSVHAVKLVGVEPVGSEEHGEQEDDVRVVRKSLPETDELRLPGGVLHEDDLGAVLTDDLAGVAEAERQEGTAEHENDEPDVGPIAHSSIVDNVDVLSQGNLSFISYK